MDSQKSRFLTKVKFLAKELIPPFIWKALKKLNSSEEYGFFGNYSSWQEAKDNSTGYDSELILNKVKDSLLQVKEGKAVYERDSVLFDRIQYSFPVLAALLRIALENEGKLSILDFGGSLGSSYFQCKDFLSGVKELRWSIVEQPKFVACGKQYFEDDKLKFYETIESCLNCQSADVALLSSVIQYMETPYSFLEQFTSFGFRYLVIDLTACFLADDNNDRLTVQRVNPVIYQGSYPAWVFNQKKLLKQFSASYNLIADFKSLYSADLERLNAELKGFIFQKK